MHEIEGVRLQLTIEQIILSERDVAEMFLVDERARRFEKFRINIGARD
jgi:hypothetical protein